MTFEKLGITRRGLLGAFAATTITAAPTFGKAAGFLRGAGDVRRIRMYSPRTGETVDTIYWLEGKYIKDSLKDINYFITILNRFIHSIIEFIRRDSFKINFIGILG